LLNKIFFQEKKMSTKAGAGRSNDKDSFQAGVLAAKAAMDQAGIEKCDFVFMFSTVGYNQDDLLKGVRSVTGNAPLSGCSGEGVITQSGPEGEVVFTSSGPRKGIDVAGVMVFSSDEIKFYNYLETGLKESSTKTGEEIGRKIKNDTHTKPLLLLTFVDGLKVNVKDFFTGIDSILKQPLLLCGALAGDNFILGNTFQFFNDRVVNDAASCVLIAGDVKIEIGVSHGCVPLGLEKTITKAQANTVFEIDNQPAWDFFRQYLDDSIKVFTKEIRTFLDLGIKLPDDMATEYDKYIIRAPLSQNPDGSLNFATEIPVGTKVKIIRRNAEKISMGAKNMAERIKAKLGDKIPIAVFHVDCAARGKMFFGDDVKEKGIDVLQDTFGKNIPWLGLFACGELAPIKNVNYYHNQTAVICVIYK
jgi:hypothetical protein